MTKEELQKVYRRMLWVIPGMLLAMLGDYCMGIEPKDSTTISGMISSGWLSIADWRIALSNIGGLLGTVCYTLAALPFAAFLKSLLPRCGDKWDRRLLKLYIAGLLLGVMCFLYFHLECGTLIHNFNLLYDAAGGDTALAAEMWDRSYLVQIVPYWSTFFAFELAILIGWIALILRGTFALHDIFSKAKYGDMQLLVDKLRKMGYEKVELIDTTNGKFISPREAKWMALSGSALLLGKK